MGSRRARTRARQGLILVTGHLGNWELGGAYVAARGVPLEAVARRMENPLFDRYLTKTRERIGMTVIHDADAVRRVPRALREGHAVAFLVDQGAVGLASTWVPFFGRFAKTPRGPAVFALRLGAPVMFGVRAAAAERAVSRSTSRRSQSCRPGTLDADVDRIVADVHERAGALGPARARAISSGIIVAGSTSGPARRRELGDPS